MPIIIPSADPVYFTVAEARAFDPALADATKYPDAAIEAMRATVEQALEYRCGVAFVPRTATETVDATGSFDVLLRPRVTSVTALSVDGVTVADLSGLRVYGDGRVYNPAGWNNGRANVVLTYVHGYPIVPGEVKLAALLLTKHWLVTGPIDERTTSFSTDEGTFSLSTPGLRGVSFGIPKVESVLQAYSLQTAVA